ncbi:MAG: hypothetical protein AAFX76_11040, partial [Planctomycetota bacterium]
MSLISSNPGWDSTRADAQAAAAASVAQQQQFPGDVWRACESWRAVGRDPGLGIAKPRRHADAVAEWFASRWVGLWPTGGRYLRLAERVLGHEAELSGMGSTALGNEVQAWRERARRGRIRKTDERVRALAVIRESGRRAWGMNAYREQAAAALALLDGRMTEMATGEGKTLVTAMAAAFLGWRGRGVHVITVNDYLAGRDADWARPMFSACGLRVASVTGETAPPERAAGYAADVTYTTNKEAAADYLRDGLARRAGSRRAAGLASTLAREVGAPRKLGAAGAGEVFPGGGGGGVVMRGLEAALVDEADSVLLDEAVTPLI